MLQFANVSVAKRRLLRHPHGCCIRIQELKNAMIKIKRAYEEPSNEDGFRILVDRICPRGLSKEKVKVDLWLKEIAPSEGLRKWLLMKLGRTNSVKDTGWNLSKREI